MIGSSGSCQEGSSQGTLSDRSAQPHTNHTFQFQNLKKVKLKGESENSKVKLKEPLGILSDCSATPQAHFSVSNDLTKAKGNSGRKNLRMKQIPWEQGQLQFSKSKGTF